jgi:predicted transcriptional regulator
MATSKAKVTFTCSPEFKEKLQKWADSESRTLSNLCELVMQKALDEHEQSNAMSKKPK